MSEQLALFDLTAPSLPPNMPAHGHDCRAASNRYRYDSRETRSGMFTVIMAQYRCRQCGDEWEIEAQRYIRQEEVR